MSTFKRVIIDHGQAEIAKVNLKNRTLYLSPKIWDGLPEAEKEFVLLHEKGHLNMQTADEFAANAYAVKNFVPAGRFTNKELGKRIMVMRSVLDKADGKTANFSGSLDSAGIAGAIFENLSVLGIGSKSRQKEAAANAAANVSVLEAQAKASAAKSAGTMKVVLIAGVLLIVAAAIYFTLKMRSK